VGLALSDPSLTIARPFDVLGARRLDVLFEALARIIAEQEVDRIVLGLPLQMDGTPGLAAEEVEEFAEKLRARFALPVELWDERLTTAQAERAMLDADLSRAKRKLRRDKVAAQMILQSYLDAHRRKAPGS
jgi:putative Holliday junction resolvase